MVNPFIYPESIYPEITSERNDSFFFFFLICIYLFIYLFIYGCVGSLFLCEGFL